MLSKRPSPLTRKHIRHNRERNYSLNAVDVYEHCLNGDDVITRSQRK